MNSTHGMSKTRQYNTWANIKDRCSLTNKDFKNYKERGITMDNRWENSFEAFWEDMKDTYEDNLSIDRIDNNKGYYKENCKWSTSKEQCNNRRSSIICEYKGEKLTLALLADKYHLSRHLLYDRYRYGWTIEECVETPMLRKTYNYKGIIGSLTEICVENNIKPHVVGDRLRLGWNITEAVGTPNRGRRKSICRIVE